MKKQIIFIEPFFTIPAFKIAKSLKKYKDYETILVIFTKVNEKTEKFLKDAYDKIITLEINDPRKLSFSNYIGIFKSLRGNKSKNLYKELKSLKPYLVQITGPETRTFFSRHLFKNYPLVYFAHDVWKPYIKKLSFKKNTGRAIPINKLIEKSLFKRADGVLHKGHENELETLKIKTKGNNLQYLSGCLDDWIINPNLKSKYSKKDKESHFVYAGRPWIEWEGHVSFKEVIEKVTSQKIHFHIFTPPLSDNDAKIFNELEAKNKYFHFHGELNGEKLNKELSKFDYGTIPDFYDFNLTGREFADITFGTKILTYLEAGIPMLISDTMGYTLKVVCDNNLGYEISYNDLEDLNKYLKNKNISLKNIKKAQNDFRMSRIIKNIIPFYEKIHKKFYKNKKDPYAHKMITP